VRSAARAIGTITPLRLGGGLSIRPAGGAAISPEAAGTRRADRGWGIGDAVLCGHRGVPGPGRAAGSQPEESRSAASGGEQATSGRAPAGQRTPTEWPGSRLVLEGWAIGR